MCCFQGSPSSCLDTVTKLVVSVGEKVVIKGTGTEYRKLLTAEL